MTAQQDGLTGELATPPMGGTAAAPDGEAVVREAVEALLSIGAWGLHDSRRPDAWTLAMRARRFMDGDPMTGEEAAGFRAKAERALQRPGGSGR